MEEVDDNVLANVVSHLDAEDLAAAAHLSRALGRACAAAWPAWFARRGAAVGARLSCP